MLEKLRNIVLNGDHIPALNALRQKGLQAFAGLPSNKDETFKYTAVANVLTDDMLVNSSVKCSEEACHCREKNFPFDAYELHFCNGKLHEHFHPIDGIEISSLLDAIASHEVSKYVNQFDISKYPFAALNTAYLEQGLFIRVSKILDKPLALIYHNHEQGFKNVRNIIVVEKDAGVELIELYHGEHCSYFINIVNEIYVSKNAFLKHYKIQNEYLKSVHISLSHVQLKSNATYSSFTAHKGSLLARNETHLLLTRENARALVNAAYLIKDSSLIDTTTDVEHLSKNTFSNQIVRGVIDADATGVFQGKIHIAPNAVQTEGHQIHKALLLSDAAKIDVKPELEIFADDVKCSHGATSGDLDGNEIFYLQSRGISQKDARQILSNAFLYSAFEDIDNTDIKKFFEEFILE